VPRFPVVSCASTKPFTDVRTELAAALTSPVRWRETMLALEQAGCTRYVEVGPGKVLARLGKRILPDNKVETPAEELAHA
jgi:[acyl-carrier-protein] S-malonyltransferase